MQGQYDACRALLEEKKEYIEKLAERLLENEVLSLPDIVEIMGPRPFPMKESVKEYLEELKDREAVEAKLVEDAFAAWLEKARESAAAEGGDQEALAAIEAEVAESEAKGERAGGRAA